MWGHAMSARTQSLWPAPPFPTQTSLALLTGIFLGMRTCRRPSQGLWRAVWESDPDAPEHSAHLAALTGRWALWRGDDFTTRSSRARARALRPPISRPRPEPQIGPPCRSGVLRERPRAARPRDPVRPLSLEGGPPRLCACVCTNTAGLRGSHLLAGELAYHPSKTCADP